MVISLIIAVAAILVFILIYMNTRIDNLNDSINTGFQEIRSLIAASNRDFENRIDNTNNRIDQIYQAPVINS